MQLMKCRSGKHPNANVQRFGSPEQEEKVRITVMGGSRIAEVRHMRGILFALTRN
jgi:hypothetical protein